MFEEKLFQLLTDLRSGKHEVKKEFSFSQPDSTEESESFVDDLLFTFGEDSISCNIEWSYYRTKGMGSSDNLTPFDFDVVTLDYIDIENFVYTENGEEKQFEDLSKCPRLKKLFLTYVIGLMDMIDKVDKSVWMYYVKEGISGMYWSKFQDKIDNMRQKVRILHSKYGTGSKEYEDAFDELHDLIMKSEDEKHDFYSGKLPKPNENRNIKNFDEFLNEKKKLDIKAKIFKHMANKYREERGLPPNSKTSYDELMKKYESVDEIYDTKINKMMKLYNILKKLETYLKYPTVIPDINKVFTSQGLPLETVSTLIKYVKWISIPNIKYPNVYKWSKFGEVDKIETLWLLDMVDECKMIMIDIEETKKEDIKNWKGHKGRTDKKILKYLRFLLELKLNYTTPNDEPIINLIKDIKTFSQIETTLKKRGIIIKNADNKYQFIFKSIPTLDDAIKLDEDADKDIEGYDIRKSSVNKVFEVLKYLYENYKEGDHLSSNFEKKFGVANEIRNIIQEMGLLKNISNDVKKKAFYKYIGEEPTMELARIIFEKTKESFLNLDKVVGESTNISKMVSRNDLTSYYICRKCKSPSLSFNKVLKRCNTCHSDDIMVIDEDMFYTILKSKIGPELYKKVSKQREENKMDFLDLTMMGENPRLNVN